MSIRLSLKMKNALVALHVVAVVAWFGSTMCMLLLSLYAQRSVNGEELYYTLSGMHVIDDTLLKYPALATLITGILLSVWTHWGLVKYYWIVMKLVMTIGIILLGIFFINDWFGYLLETASRLGMASMDQELFQSTWQKLNIASIGNLTALAAMVVITYYKPFGKIRKK
ncbi:DUF2269 family protein [Paenibacillus silviterrae]|uniref:DUF2269 family protein n=1 Tax=Paenibacillus silviterrae TaxID=3242194 RepID=UPI002543F3FF|nr:DUF2269 family protein [Paenibacillus chinjuensis]